MQRILYCVPGNVAGALAAYRDNADFYFNATRLSPEHTAADRRAWDAGSDYTVQTLFPRLSEISFKTTTQIKTPLLFLLGRDDEVVPATIAEARLTQVKASKKTLVWFEHSSHLPMIEEPGRTLEALLRHARPLAEKQSPEREQATLRRPAADSVGRGCTRELKQTRFTNGNTGSYTTFDPLANR